MNYDYGLTPEQSRCLARERDEARAKLREVETLSGDLNDPEVMNRLSNVQGYVRCGEPLAANKNPEVERLKAEHHAALESLRERCAAQFDYNAFPGVAKRIRAVPLEAP